MKSTDISIILYLIRLLREKDPSRYNIDIGLGPTNVRIRIQKLLSRMGS